MKPWHRFLVCMYVCVHDYMCVQVTMRAHECINMRVLTYTGAVWRRRTCSTATHTGPWCNYSPSRKYVLGAITSPSAMILRTASEVKIAMNT